MERELEIKKRKRKGGRVRGERRVKRGAKGPERTENKVK
jgi:hypothetical protein